MGDDKRAPWWREALLPRLRRKSVVLATAPLGLLTGCFDLEARPDDPPSHATHANEIETRMNALEVQKNQGWNAGELEQPLEFPGATSVDAAGGPRWRAALTSLTERLRPSRAQYMPWYVPTLFQSLLGDPSESLRQQLVPIRTAEMDREYGRGLAVRNLFEQAGFPSDTAIVVDAPGPRAVAVAAALADRFEPVFAFGNWPHPAGVVPAHETLAATLFYLPLFEWARGLRPEGAPPVWVLDSNRLNEYGDADHQFDNRYFVKLPSAAELQQMGIRHLLYVTAGDRELDDLNSAFVELCNRGIDVQLVSLDEFERDAEAGDPVEEPEPVAPGWVLALWIGGGGWWYGGHPFWHSCFWESHHWYHPARAVVVGPPMGRRHITVAPPAVRRVPAAVQWVPAARPMRFFGGGFGSVSVRAARSNGAILGVYSRSPSFGSSGQSSGRSFGSFGRSGSLGRVGGGGFSA
jgi:hypothetical protein